VIIYKKELQNIHGRVTHIPYCVQVIKIELQNGIETAWYLHDDDCPEMKIVTVWTGRDIDIKDEVRHLGTTVSCGLVNHYFIIN